MKKEIAHTKYYELVVDTEKNRVYLKIKGFWHGIIDVPDYLTHWEQIAKMVKKNFTILLDSREAVTHPVEVQEVRQKAQQIAINAGLLKAAEVVSSNIIAEFQSDAMAKRTHYPKGKFKSIEEAEIWLDELVKNSEK